MRDIFLKCTFFLLLIYKTKKKILKIDLIPLPIFFSLYIYFNREENTYKIHFYITTYSLRKEKTWHTCTLWCPPLPHTPIVWLCVVCVCLCLCEREYAKTNFVYKKKFYIHTKCCWCQWPDNHFYFDWNWKICYFSLTCTFYLYGRIIQFTLV